jgi:hypothetical protein
MEQIIISFEQLKSIESFLSDLKSNKYVENISILHNQFIPEYVVVRVAETEIGDNGGVGTSIKYYCFNQQGVKNDCLNEFEKSFYSLVRDFVPINLKAPNVKIV